LEKDEYGIPKFETQRLILRGVRLEDAPSYQKHFAHYEIIQHLTHHVPWPYPEDGVETFLKESIFPEQGKERWLWVITEKESPSEVIGCVDLFREGVPENRGFWLSKDHWGKGFMTEAVDPVMDYAFNQLGFEKLIFSNAKGNEKSRRVKEKTGARLVGTKPSKLVNPSYTESEIWELSRQEWLEFKASR
jgi:ribosomal-protein-alanine N-acetyltransferase